MDIRPYEKIKMMQIDCSNCKNVLLILVCSVPVRCFVSCHKYEQLSSWTETGILRISKTFISFRKLNSSINSNKSTWHNSFLVCVKNEFLLCSKLSFLQELHPVTYYFELCKFYAVNVVWHARLIFSFNFNSIDIW